MRLALAVAFLAAATPAFAQTAREGPFRLNVSGGAQVDTRRLDESIALIKHAETAPVTVELARKRVPFFDVGLSVRLIRDFGVNVSATYLTDRGNALLHAEIPHPFFLNQRRPISGGVDRVLHSELATHTDVVYVIVSPRIDLSLFGGATFMKVTQDFVSDVVFSETYPYDSASFVNAALSRTHASGVGYNLGADVTYKLGRYVGIGGLLRYAPVDAPFSVSGLESRVGGLQAGVGLRLISKPRARVPPRRGRRRL